MGLVDMDPSGFCGSQDQLKLFENGKSSSNKKIQVNGPSCDSDRYELHTCYLLQHLGRHSTSNQYKMKPPAYYLP
jgi:hypothetical protein